MRQASRRSWRIGQQHGVKVVFMAYRNTLQADALKLVAQKLQSSLAVEGELPEDGLAAYGDDGDDLMLALARKLVTGEEDAETVEDLFARARNAEAEAETLLVDDGWHAPEPVALAADWLTETPPLAAPVPGGAAQDDDAPERHQSLFSWAEFMADEPAAPRGRGRRVQLPPAGASLFAWALEVEREREPAGALR